MRYIYLLISSLIFIAHTGYSQQIPSVSVIPEPKKIQLTKERFELSPLTTIFYEGEAGRTTAELFNEFLNSNYGFKSQIRPAKSLTAKSSAVIFRVDKLAKPETYQLLVNEGRIEVSGNATGLFYGLQTLEQLIPIEKTPGIFIPGVIIDDEARFGYRGLMLDVSRHFHSAAYVKKFLDVMSHFKLNRFHWHLTDDQGWRIEIKKYPKLQSIAAWRDVAEGLHNSPFTSNGRYGGYYTQEEVKDIVAYAAKRHITVIPEIEMPGHSTAALAAYPHLGCTGGPYKVPVHGGITKDVYCAGKDSTFLFLQDVLTEVMALFPSEYLHIGGDETPKERWTGCAKCQTRIKEQGLKDEHELQSYFVQRIEKFVNQKGRKIIGWDEILEGGLAPNATVMSWRGEQGGIAAARQHHDVIMSPYTYLYLDYYQGDSKTEPPAFPTYLPLSRVYAYEPLSDSLTAEQHRFIKGVQANVWGESITDSKHVEYMTFPRALAHAETAWSPASAKNYDRFLEKLALRLSALERAGVNFRIPEPKDFNNYITTEGSALVDLSPTVINAKVYYTMDGSQPTVNSKESTRPFRIQLTDNVPVVVKMLMVLPSGKHSSVYSKEYLKKPFKTAVTQQPSNAGLAFKAYVGKVPLARELRIPTSALSGVVPEFGLSPFSSVGAFGAIFEGYFLADADDIYTFHVNSDDGVVLYIGDDIVLDNDGEHAATEVSGSVPLRKGYHKIRLQYFDAGGGRKLEVKAGRRSGNYPLKDKLFN